MSKLKSLFTYQEEPLEISEDQMPLESTKKSKDNILELNESDNANVIGEIDETNIKALEDAVNQEVKDIIERNTDRKAPTKTPQSLGQPVEQVTPTNVDLERLRRRHLGYN